MEQCESGHFPPKAAISLGIPEAVKETSAFLPKFRIRQLDFIYSPVKPTSVVLHLPPRTPVTTINFEFPTPQPQVKIKASNGTPKPQKHCSCKRSKCLKLYCECFASGICCDGCKCVHCYNNVENEAARQEAVENILQRNPNAFGPKIASSPLRTQDNGDEENDSPMVGKHKKGCHCKKTRCLKKYCECFQAKILCSENCKCVDCKNFEVCDERLAVLHGDHSNISTCIQQDNPAIAVTINLLGNRFSPALGKRKGHELPDSNKKGSQIQRLTPHQEVSPLRDSGPLSALSVDPVHQVVRFAVLHSSKFTYRSLLANVIHPEGIIELCSDLVIASEFAQLLAVKNSASDPREPRDNDPVSFLASHHKDNCQEGPDTRKVSEEHLSENRTDRIGNAEFRSGNAELKEVVYMKKERLVLGDFLSCLKKLIVFGNMKGSIGLPGQTAFHQRCN